MFVLQVKQVHKDGHVKIWKQSETSAPVTFGQSRKASLLSIDAGSGSYELVFKCIARQWHVIHFNTDEADATHKVQNGETVQLANSTLHLTLTQRNSFLVQTLSTLQKPATSFESMVVVTLGPKIISTHLLDRGLKFAYTDHQQNHVFDFNNQKQFRLGDLLFQIVPVTASEVSALKKQKASSHFNFKENRISMGLFGAVFLMIGLSLMIQQKKLVVPAAQPISVPVSSVIKSHFKKQIEKPRPSQQKVSAQNDKTTSGGGRSASLLKGAIGARISKLLSKVSATEARTQNIILVKQGLKAGLGDSGRALAAVGSVNSSGRNWTGDTTQSNLAVGTTGRGGGHGTGHFGGGLSQGKTGQGGVGLIEEESEIVGGLDREVIAQYIKTQLGQILYCYERQLSASPELYGKIAVKFTIAGSGSVETQTINDTTLKNHNVENCILNKVAKWKFPEPRGGTKVLVTYPFLFKSTN
jgi:hypothetical protein